MKWLGVAFAVVSFCAGFFVLPHGGMGVARAAILGCGQPATLKNTLPDIQIVNWRLRRLVDTDLYASCNVAPGETQDDTFELALRVKNLSAPQMTVVSVVCKVYDSADGTLVGRVQFDAPLPGLDPGDSGVTTADAAWTYSAGERLTCMTQPPQANNPSPQGT